MEVCTMAQLKSTNITGNLSVTGNVLASKIIKFNGTSDDILMGDGSTTSKQGLIDSLEAAMEGNSWRPVKYGTTTVSDTSTTLEFIAGSNIGLTFTTDGKLTIANSYSYSLPLAANGTRGGIQVGYTASGANLPVQLSSEKAYVALTKAAIDSVVTIPAAQTQSDWNQTDTSKVDYIKNKPTIPTLPTNVVTGSSLTSDQVILGNGNSTIKASGKTLDKKGNRADGQIVCASGAGSIHSVYYVFTENETARASWGYNASTDCVELAWR